ncbi:hypothetical protein EBR25_09580 [bacterium]|nr:hypothetical protein [bacterium]
MGFETHNNSDVSSTGTCLQGYISCGYKDIVRIFGKPCTGDGYKVDAEWVIRFSDGEIATIYNWKNGINYCGHDGLDVEDIRSWNIGGHSKAAVRRVTALLSEPWPIHNDIRQEMCSEL